MMDWLFVDDSKGDRDAFAASLCADGLVSVRAISAGEARGLLEGNRLAPAGVLMDIDLSNEPGGNQSGLGLTADIRAAQNRASTPPFPIVRFSYRAKVAQNIGTDPSSDDYFDLLIDKDHASEPGVSSGIQRQLAGVEQVYAAIAEQPTIPKFFALSDELWSLWGSESFDEQIGVVDRVHIKARLFVQALIQPGLLISEELLAIRLGINRASSTGWKRFCESIEEFRYTGVAAACFNRWWARGLELWWEKRKVDNPLAATSIAERHKALSADFADLEPLVMPANSPGARPWRYCELTMEESSVFLPLDPSRAVRFRPRIFAPDWIDPTYAALGPAMKHAEDRRLDRSDLSRLRVIARGDPS